uniref:Uncharacterized protein n=1 Tax=Erpetoichthys calabaricus TaxID=27687 RepID=A0A8C4TGS2_ERPCA
MADWNREQDSGSDRNMLCTNKEFLADKLAIKMSLPNSFRLDIENEEAGVSSFADVKDSDAMSTKNFLTGSMKRLSSMVRYRREHHKLLCYLSVGIVMLFVFLYYTVVRTP